MMEQHYSDGLPLAQGLERFEQAFGRKPDIVSVASNFWDMAGM